MKAVMEKGGEEFPTRAFVTEVFSYDTLYFGVLCRGAFVKDLRISNDMLAFCFTLTTSGSGRSSCLPLSSLNFCFFSDDFCLPKYIQNNDDPVSAAIY